MAYHLHRNGQSIPHDLAKLRDMAKNGDLAQDEYIYVDEKGEWIGAAQVPEMAGAWNIGENEQTVAMDLPPDFVAMFDELEAKRKAAKEQQQETAPRPVPQQAAVAQQAPAAQQAPVAMREVAPQRSPTPQFVAPVAAQRSTHEELRAPDRRQDTSRAPAVSKGEVVDPLKATLLTVLTCGIMGFVWAFQRTAELESRVSKAKPKRQFLQGSVALIAGGIVANIVASVTGIALISAVGSLAMLAAGVLVVMWAMSINETLSELAKNVGVNLEPKPWLGFVALVFPAFVFLFQSDLNAVWQAAGARSQR